jgi:hypothetical protein
MKLTAPGDSAQLSAVCYQEESSLPLAAGYLFLVRSMLRRFFVAVLFAAACHIGIIWVCSRGGDGSSLGAVFVVYLLPGMLLCQLLGIDTVGSVLVTTAIIYIIAWSLAWFVVLILLGGFKRVSSSTSAHS